MELNIYYEYIPKNFNNFIHFVDDPEEPIANIAPYGDDNVLISVRSGDGIFSQSKDGTYTLDKRPFRPVSAADGSYADPDGTLWITTRQGIHRFDPRLKKNYEEPFAAVIRAVKTKRIVVSSPSQRIVFFGRERGGSIDVV